MPLYLLLAREIKSTILWIWMRIWILHIFKSSGSVLPIFTNFFLVTSTRVFLCGLPNLILLSPLKRGRPPKKGFCCVVVFNVLLLLLCIYILVVFPIIFNGVCSHLLIRKIMFWFTMYSRLS